MFPRRIVEANADTRPRFTATWKPLGSVRCRCCAAPPPRRGPSASGRSCPGAAPDPPRNEGRRARSQSMSSARAVRKVIESSFMGGESTSDPRRDARSTILLRAARCCARLGSASWDTGAGRGPRPASQQDRNVRASAAESHRGRQPSGAGVRSNLKEEVPPMHHDPRSLPRSCVAPSAWRSLSSSLPAAAHAISGNGKPRSTTSTSARAMARC